MRLMHGATTGFLILGLGLSWCPAASARSIPKPIEAMLQAAKPAELAAVQSVAKRAAPGHAAQIDALAAELVAKWAAQSQGKLEQGGLLDGWEGEGALGGSFLAGNTDQLSFSTSLAFKKRSRRWEHELDLSFDYLESNGKTRRERIYAGYSGKFDLSEQAFFSIGLLSFERDPFSGLDYRFTESLGAGYRLAKGKEFSWTVEGGPALRQTAFTDGREKSELDILGQTDLRWKPAANIALTQRTGFLASQGSNSLYSKSAATASISGGLSARLSLDILHESEPPTGREQTDTITRASIVYGF